MKFALLIATASAVTLRTEWPGAYRENNVNSVDLHHHSNTATPSMITANREMPAIASQANERKAPLYPYNTVAAGHTAAPAVTQDVRFQETFK